MACGKELEVIIILVLGEITKLKVSAFMFGLKEIVMKESGADVLEMATVPTSLEIVINTLASIQMAYLKAMVNTNGLMVIYIKAISSEV